MAKKQKQNKKDEKAGAGRDALVRMNYLYQASVLFATIDTGSTEAGGSASRCLSRFYMRSMKATASRMVLR
ncbi:hypothetical protein HDU83_001132, partial [Entophlyctis luteolus]